MDHRPILRPLFAAVRSIRHPGRDLQILAVALLFAVSAGPALARVRIGVTPGSLADSVQVAAAEAKAQGLAVELVEFTDWTTPNLALANCDLDVTYFQHQAFLDNAVKETGFPLGSVALGILPNIGLYSEKHASLAALPDGAKVAVANDPAITVSGQAAPDLSALAAAAGAPVRLLQAGIERIQGHAVGRMLVAVDGAGPDAEDRLRGLGGTIERIGYVAADD